MGEPDSRRRKDNRSLLADSILAELEAAEAFIAERDRKRAEKGEAPLGDQARKRNFAEGLSRALAPRIANALRHRFRGIYPDETGRYQESRARTPKGYKKLDVNYSTAELGLALGISIKTVNFRDARTKRYTKNYTRADAELRAEASDYHERQPYAVMIALVFMPIDACDDGTVAPSSFGGAVQTFRFRANRQDPDDPPTLFERVFIGLYETEPEERGRVVFFDVMQAPPRNGRPRTTLSFKQVIDEIVSTYDKRNHPVFEWADAEPEHVTPPPAAEGVLDESIAEDTDGGDEATEEG